MAAKHLVAETSFVFEVDGTQHVVHQGDALPPTHPAVKACPDLFGTPAPVEKRGAVR